MAYAEKLRNPKWQKRRLEILNRDEFKCKSCHVDDVELHVHHKKYTGEPWQAPDEDLLSLCKHCHAVVENWKVIPEYIRWNKDRTSCFFMWKGHLCFENIEGVPYGALPHDVAVEFAKLILEFENVADAG